LQTKRNHISLTTPQASSKLPVLSDEAERPGKGFSRKEHLKKRVDINRVFKKGRVVSCPGTKLFFLANEAPCNRIVITFTRKYGNAVQRNRARRLGREAYRLMKGELNTGYDMVFLTYPKPADAASKSGSLAETSEVLRALFNKAGIIRKEA